METQYSMNIKEIAEKLNSLSPNYRIGELQKIRKEIIAKLGEVKPGFANTRVWVYKGLDRNIKTPVYLKYRAYVGKVSNKKSDQRISRGIWAVKIKIRNKTFFIK